MIDDYESIDIKEQIFFLCLFHYKTLYRILDFPILTFSAQSFFQSHASAYYTPSPKNTCGPRTR